MNKHVTKRFLEWFEGRVSAAEQSAIEAHLLACHTCKAYYDQMSTMIDVVDRQALPTLQPDPYLPTRIKAEVDIRRRSALSPKAGWVTRFRWVASSATLAAAITIGIYLGKNLATQDQVSTDEYSFASESYQTLWDNSLADSWAEVIANSTEVEK